MESDVKSPTEPPPKKSKKSKSTKAESLATKFEKMKRKKETGDKDSLASTCLLHSICDFY